MKVLLAPGDRVQQAFARIARLEETVARLRRRSG